MSFRPPRESPPPAAPADRLHEVLSIGVALASVSAPETSAGSKEELKFDNAPRKDGKNWPTPSQNHMFFGNPDYYTSDRTHRKKDDFMFFTRDDVQQMSKNKLVHMLQVYKIEIDKSLKRWTRYIESEKQDVKNLMKNDGEFERVEQGIEKTYGSIFRNILSQTREMAEDSRSWKQMQPMQLKEKMMLYQTLLDKIPTLSSEYNAWFDLKWNIKDGKL